jgi:mannose-1-phosphate guanylyltransferase
MATQLAASLSDIMLHAVVMAGGSGTRFWPESRQRRPKQLLPILGGQAMLAETVARVQPLIPVSRVWIVTNALQEAGVREACPSVPADQILVEPCARNTAACAAFAAASVFATDPDATLAVLPADHAIRPNQEFQRSLEAGAQVAQEPGTLVTFGIEPNHPATGYGYIRQGKPVCEEFGLQVYSVDAFTEKPSESRAQAFLEEGVYLWNAGIFVWRADSILDAFARHQLEIHTAIRAIVDSGNNPQERAATLAELYPDLPSLPVDIAILERDDQVRVLRAPYHWSDVGSWRALFDELEHDQDGNVAVLPNGGQLLAEDSNGVLAYSRVPKTIAILGMQDVVVVHTEDAVLVAPRARAEEVKRFVDRLKEEGQEGLL